MTKNFRRNIDRVICYCRDLKMSWLEHFPKSKKRGVWNKYVLGGMSKPRFSTRTFHTFSLIWSSFSPSPAWFRRRRCMLVFGTVGGHPLHFQVLSLYFLGTIRELSSKQTFFSSCLVLASSRDILFCLFNSVVSFWCWWCCCVTLLLFIVGVSLVFEMFVF